LQHETTIVHIPLGSILDATNESTFF